MNCDEDERRRQQGIISSRRICDGMGPDWMDFLLEAADDIPRDWLEMTPQEQLDHFRYRVRLTQRELERRSGVAQSQISRLLSGDDSRLSTWQRLYEAMGVRLVLVPLAPAPLHVLMETVPPDDGSWPRTARNAFEQRLARLRAKSQAPDA